MRCGERGASDPTGSHGTSGPAAASLERVSDAPNQRLLIAPGGCVSHLRAAETRMPRRRLYSAAAAPGWRLASPDFQG